MATSNSESDQPAVEEHSVMELAERWKNRELPMEHGEVEVKDSGGVQVKFQASNGTLTVDLPLRVSEEGQ